MVSFLCTGGRRGGCTDMLAWWAAMPITSWLCCTLIILPSSPLTARPNSCNMALLPPASIQSDIFVEPNRRKLLPAGWVSHPYSVRWFQSRGFSRQSDIDLLWQTIKLNDRREMFMQLCSRLNLYLLNLLNGRKHIMLPRNVVHTNFHFYSVKPLEYTKIIPEYSLL